MRFKYHKQIVDMLYDEWDLGKASSGAKGKTCAWIYWFEVLGDAEKIIIEKRDGNAIGVCGYSKWRSRKHWLRKKFYRLARKLLIYSPLIKDKQAIIKYSNDYDYLPEELEGYFDGEVTLIIVEKQHRGKEIGEGMLSRVFELAAADGLKNLQILTDESCNFEFYDRMGCKKIYEKVIPNGEPGKCGETQSEKGFVYEKKLKPGVVQ